MLAMNKASQYLPHDIVTLLLVVCFFNAATPTTLISKDMEALVSFMAGIDDDPNGIFNNWNSSAVHVCNWTGVACNPAGDRVVELLLTSKALSGVISPAALSGLGRLSVLDLSGNFFRGRIPAEIGRLTRLTQLSFDSNLLQGSIPVEMGMLRRLEYLNIASNKLSGNIPASLFCNSSALQYVDLSNNSLTGEIPLPKDCMLPDLRFLLLWSNRLVGSIPSSLSNSTKLEWLDLDSNFLTGELCSNVFRQMPRLQYLYLSYNGFTSRDGNTNLEPFFSSLVNSSRLQELELAGNLVSGMLPSIVGGLSISLLQLHLEENSIYGPIPPSISNLINLTLLNLSSNLLNGSIPPEIGRMGKLERVYMSSMLLTGEIPETFGDIPHLGLLDLSNNMLSGSIPDTLSNLTQLRRLRINNNLLNGTIPLSLGRCTNLEILDLSYNSLSGGIPDEVAGLSSLKLYLNLSNNILQGPIPLELSKMDMVLAIDLSANNLSGAVPPQLASCIALEHLNLSGNILHGTLPFSIGNLPYLQDLDLSMNRLTGPIPSSIQASSTIQHLNFSYNNFVGFIPDEGTYASLTKDSFIGNRGLCGSIPGMHHCQNKRVHRFIIIWPVLIFFFTTICFLICFYGYHFLFKSKFKRTFSAFSHTSNNHDHKEVENIDIERECKFPRVSYNELVEATGGFDESRLIGSGRFGHVYKGTLRDGTRIAVKVLDLKSGVEIVGSFKRECQVLKRTRHRNLIRIITACSRPDFKALVLPLMSNGSLESHLYPRHGSGPSLSLVQLVNICSDVAEGMAYLHHHSHVQVVHCDLKPSNVLLDGNLTALISDFGIARLITGGPCVSAGGDDVDAGDDMDSNSCNSTQGLLCGSIGYIAPEYGMGRQASTRGDVYSYGVMVLEIVTGKRPTDVIFQAGFNLHQWVKNHYPNGLGTIIEEWLLRSAATPTPIYRRVWWEVVVELIELGLVCTQSLPSTRPTMMDVALEMGRLKDYLSCKDWSSIRSVLDDPHQLNS